MSDLMSLMMNTWMWLERVDNEYLDACMRGLVMSL